MTYYGALLEHKNRVDKVKANQGFQIPSSFIQMNQFGQGHGQQYLEHNSQYIDRINNAQYEYTDEHGQTKFANKYVYINRKDLDKSYHAGLTRPTAKFTSGYKTFLENEFLPQLTGIGEQFKLPGGLGAIMVGELQGVTISGKTYSGRGADILKNVLEDSGINNKSFRSHLDVYGHEVFDKYRDMYSNTVKNALTQIVQSSGKNVSPDNIAAVNSILEQTIDSIDTEDRPEETESYQRLDKFSNLFSGGMDIISLAILAQGNKDTPLHDFAKRNILVGLGLPILESFRPGISKTAGGMKMGNLFSLLGEL